MLINKLDNLIELLLDNKINKEQLMKEFNLNASNILDILSYKAIESKTFNEYAAYTKTKKLVYNYIFGEEQC